MSESHDDTREQRVNEVIAAYLKAVEAGDRPDRAALLRRHPDLAGELRSFFADQDAVLPGAAPPDEMATLAPAAPGAGPVLVRYFGDYEAVEEIARGGMGVVYRAKQVSLDRVVALKMILAGQLASGADVDRFRLEAQAAATLDHPNILPIHEVGEHQGQQYFSMKLVGGGSLADVIPQLGGQPARVVDLVRRVAEAVHHAHQRGILHRDLKPANVLLDSDGTPYVSDFGLAKRVEGDSGLTQSGAIVGTPSYMAPEQASGARDLSTAVDVYSLGAILYECLTGRPPFRGATPLDTVLQVLEREPERPARLRPGVDPDLETICLKCLDKESARRYGSALDLADDLGRWQRGEPIQARRYSSWERARKWARRRPAVAALGAALLLATLAGLAGITWGWRQAVAAGEAALDRAEEERRARKEADALRQAEGRALRQAERNLADQHIALASQAWQAGNVPAMLDVLDRCPVQHRGWEWGYLRRLPHRDLSTLSLGEVHEVAFSPDGRLLALAASGNEVRLVHSLTGKVVRRITTPAGVQALAFSPDGRHLAIGGQTPEASPKASRDRLEALRDNLDRLMGGESPGWARVWDVQTGKEALVLETKRAVQCLAFHPDGTHVAGGFWAPLPVLLWNARTGKVERALPGAFVNGVCFVPGGRLAGVAAGELYLWDLATGQTAFSPAKVEFAFAHVAVSPDGALLAVARADHRIQFVNASDGRLGQTLTGHTDMVSGLVFSPDGRRLYSSSKDRSVRVWRVRDGSPRAILRGHQSPISALALSPDGRLLVSAGQEGVKLWDATREDHEALTLLARDPWHPAKEIRGAPRPGVFSADGERFTTCTGSSGLLTWRARSGAIEAPGPRTMRVKMVEKPPGKQPPADQIEVDIAWTPGPPGAVTGTSAFVESWDFAPDGRSVAIVVSPFGLLLASEEAFLHLLLVDLASGQPRRDLESAEVSTAVPAFSDDGRLLAAAAGHVVKVWSASTGRLLYRLGGHASPVRHLAISPDGRWLVSTSGTCDLLAVGSSKKEVRVQVWDLTTGKARWKVSLEDGLLTPPAFSPDGRWLVTPRDDFKVQVWDLQRGEACATIPYPAGDLVEHMAFGPKGGPLALAWSNVITLWEPADGKQQHQLRGHAQDVHALAFSPDGKRLVSSIAGSPRQADVRRSGEIIVWDVETGRQLLTLDGSGDVRFSPDGQMLVSMADGVAVRLWDARPVRADEPAQRVAAWREAQRSWHEGRALLGGEGAIHHLNCLLRLDSRNPTWLEQRAAHLAERQPTRALADLNLAIAIEPTAALFALRGRAHHRLGQRAQALADLTDAIRRGDDRAETIRQRGRAWLAQGEHGKALADLTFALALSPRSADAQADRGEALAALGRWREAEHHFARSLAIDDRDARRWAGRCLVLLADGREKLGRQLAQRMIQRFGGSERAEEVQEVLLVSDCLPGSVAPERLLRLALHLGEQKRLAGLGTAERAERLLVVGAALHRAGVPALALPRLRGAERLRGKEATGIEALFLAQVLAALGENAASRAALQQGTSQFAAAEAERRLGWRQRVLDRLLRQEPGQRPAPNKAKPKAEGQR